MKKTKDNSRDDMRLRVVRLLNDDPALSQRDIAKRLDVSLGSVNYCVKALIDKGWVKVNNFRRSDNKLGYAYVLTPYGVAQKIVESKQFLKRKINEYEQLKAEIASLEADATEVDSGENEPPLANEI
jgi:EPS-associated MarR family transcriptional regulator